MLKGWISAAGSFKVEHVPCPDYAGDVELTGARRGVQHTTEGSLESALAVFRVHYAPHFLVGRDAGRTRILQLLPLGRAAAALEHPDDTPPTNAGAHVQIELADFSQRHPWLPQPLEVQEALADLYAVLQQTVGIPLRYVPNAQRSRAVWDGNGGWYGHGDVPDQPDGHWDPGDLQWPTLFMLARGPAPKPIVKPFHRPMVLQPRTYTLLRRSNGLVYAENLDRPH